MPKTHKAANSIHIPEEKANMVWDEGLKEWLDRHDKITKRQEKNKQKLVEYQEKVLLSDIYKQIEDVHIAAIQTYELNIKNKFIDDSKMINIFNNSINTYFNAFTEVKEACKWSSFIFDWIEVILRSMKELYIHLESYHQRRMVIYESKLNNLK